MMQKIHVKVCGTGTYLPGEPVPIDEIEQFLGKIQGARPKVQKWADRIKPLMKEMLDVEYYHYAINRETKEYDDDNVTMAVKAGREALQLADTDAREIDLIVYASAHMHQMPTASVRIQEALDIEQCAEISIHANCTSAYKAMLVASDLIRIGRYRNALVISANISSSELRSSYYNMAKAGKEDLFLRWFLCDGAGAVLLKASDTKADGLFLEHTYIESVGGKKPSVMNNKRPAYYLCPSKEYELGLHHLSQKFQEELRAHFHEEDGSVFIKGLKRMIEKFNIDLTKLKYFQINFPSKHISELVMEECKELGIDRNVLYTKMSEMGYPGPPMAFICLDRIFREEKLSGGDLVLSFVTEVSKFMQAGYAMTYC